MDELKLDWQTTPEEYCGKPRERTLEEIRYGLEVAVNREALHRHTVATTRLTAADARFAIERSVYVEKLGTIKIKYPRDWWQALKERWFPQFMLKRWPVTYTEHRITFEARYPDFIPPRPDMRVVRVMEHYVDLRRAAVNE